MQQRSSRSGYTLVEMLTVVAIIGILSLIGIPAFMNFQRANSFRSAMRQVSTDLRAARAMAIQQAFDVRVEFQTGSTAAKEYRFFSSRDNGTTWTALRLRGAPETIKRLEGSVWFESATNLPDIGANGRVDLIFVPSGQARLDPAVPNAANTEILLRTDWENIATDHYYITVSRAGQIKASAPQCRDRIDNDGDGQIDSDDGQCSDANDNNETL